MISPGEPGVAKTGTDNCLGSQRSVAVTLDPYLLESLFEPAMAISTLVTLSQLINYCHNNLFKIGLKQLSDVEQSDGT